MKKIFILSIGTFFLLTVNSCRKKQNKKSHYTVYQAGQSGGGMVMQMQNKPADMASLTLSPREIMLAGIKTDTARVGSLSSQIILTGTTAFNPGESRIISSRAGGQIRKLYIRAPGVYVSKGEKLFDLYSPEILSAEKDYLSAVKQKNLFDEASAGITAMIKAMKLKLLRYGLTEVQIQALLQDSLVNGTVTIYSKAGGYLINKMKEEGGYVREGEAVFQLAKNNTLWVQAQLYDTEIPLLSQHPKIWVETKALPGKRLDAHIVYNNPVMAHYPRVQEVIVSIDNPGGSLQPGMLAYVYLQAGRRNPALAVPRSAVVYNGRRHYVWIQMRQPDSLSASAKITFMRMQVQLGKGNKTQVEILKGIHSGDRIVCDGVYLLNSEYILMHGKNSMAGMGM